MNKSKRRLILKNLKVSGKLLVYQLSMIAIMIAIGVITSSFTTSINTKLHEITDVWSPSLNYVQELDVLTSNYRMKQYGHLVATDSADLASYEQELAEIETQITTTREALKKLFVTETEKELYNTIEQNWSLYKQQSEQILELSRQGRTEEGGVYMVAEIYDTFKEFQSSFDKLIEYETAELQTAKQAAADTINHIYIYIILMIALSLVLSFIIGRYISSMITRPLDNIHEAIVSMSDGDFSKYDLLDYDSADELGVVTEKLRIALANLRAYVIEISDTLKDIARGDLTKDGDEITDFLGEFGSIKESLFYILKKFNKALTEIQLASAQVATDASEISDTSRALSQEAAEQASAVEEVTATVATVTDLATKSADATRQAYEQIKNSADQAEIEKQNMKELTAEMSHITALSKQIQDIATAIEDIASQTNLLSINASIEAARVGDMGKGFAVVADQIGKLASDSSNSAINARELIDKIILEIEKGNDITLSTAESFEQIISDMNSFANLAQETTETAHEQASALSQVEQGIEQIAQAVQNTAASSEENSAISVNLSEKSEQLDELVNEFKLY